MKSLALLLASGIVFVCVAARGPAARGQAAGDPSSEKVAVPLHPTHDGKDFDYWRPRMLPPYSDAERKYAIVQTGSLLSVAYSMPGGTQWMTDTVVPPMTRLLHDKSADVRWAAAHIFAGYLHEYGKSAIPDLTELLQDPDKQVRRRAVEALGTMRETAEGSIPAIVKAVRADAALAGPAAGALQRMGAKGMAAFVAMLDDPDDTIRATSVRMIGSWFVSKEQKQQLMPKLLKLMRDPSADVRTSAMREIPLTAESLPLMIELLHDKDASVRAQAAFSIPAVQEAVPGVAALLKDDDAKVRADAKIKLAKMAGVAKPLPPELLKLADDPDSWVRTNVARNLGSGGVDAVPTLTKLLQDSNSVVRGAAAESLRDIGPPAKEAATTLKSLLADRGGAIRRKGDAKWLVCHAAAEALNAILRDKDYSAGLPPIPPDGK